VPRPSDAQLAQADDDVLVRHTRDGDTRAFGVLIDRYQRRVIAICVRVAGAGYEDGQDIAQEAFLRAYTNLGKYQPGRSFFAWLYRIAVNLALNGRARRPPAGLGGAAAAGVFARLADADPAGEPAAQAERGEQARQVQAALARLPADYATVLALRYGADLDYAEIAATLELPIGTVKARLHRAKALLRPHLEPLRSEEEQ
jgi:RNA polymerase sigma-70 factor, ECF subfamily